MNQILERSSGVVRGSARIAGGLSRRVVGDTFGLVARVRHIRPAPKPDMDDVTLTRKVETKIFRDARSLKGAVDVNAVEGVIWLRGEVKKAGQIQTLEQQVRAIPEVRGVENLLHLAKTPASTRADTPRRQQRTRSSTRRPTPKTRTTGRVTDDRTDAIEREREPSPAEQTESGSGRTPAPLGAREEAAPAQPESPEEGREATPAGSREATPEEGRGTTSAELRAAKPDANDDAPPEATQGAAAPAGGAATPEDSADAT